jgi:hypothetical protein
MFWCLIDRYVKKDFTPRRVWHHASRITVERFGCVFAHAHQAKRAKNQESWHAVGASSSFVSIRVYSWFPI